MHKTLTHTLAVMAALPVVGLALGRRGAEARGPELPPAKSTAAVKEVVDLLTAKHLTAFATHNGDANKFVAALLVPGAELFVVGATYDRPGDLDYEIEHGDFTSTYEDLRSGVIAHDRVIVEDMGPNGIVPTPKKNEQFDTITIGTEKHTFDGNFAEPNHHDAHKMAYDDYVKAYTDADDRYTQLLTALIGALKK